jgi:hypothetical protein
MPVVSHTFVSAIPDDPESAANGEVLPSHWNANHTVTGAAETTTQIIAGNGLTGGGDLSTNRTLHVGAGTGITVNTDDVAIDTASTLTWSGLQTFSTGILMQERTDPSNPTANTLHLYCRDNGSGKTQLCVMFPSGSATVIATEE